jgi:cobalt transporter subunit CbtA
MLKTLLASALFAGLIAGLFAAGLQLALIVPLIAEAELYETGALVHFGGAEVAAQGAEAAHAPAPDGEGDLIRKLLTVLMTVLTTCGFGLVLVAGFALAERLRLTRIDLRTGLMFGLAAFTATQLLPSMGLSPELPGAAAGALGQRQIWWLFTVAGAVMIAAPHLFGAPHPHEFEGVVPPELAALFAARVLAVGALGWAALGALAGHFWSRERAT